MAHGKQTLVFPKGTMQWYILCFMLRSSSTLWSCLSNTHFSFFLNTEINAYFLCKEDVCVKICVCVVLHALQHKNNGCFPHHPWWHRWWHWVETLPEGPAPHHAVSWSAGAEPLCWAGPSEVRDASSAASAPAVPSVDQTGERKWRGTSVYVLMSFTARDWKITAYIRLLLNITRGWGDLAKLENIHSISWG